MLPPLSFALLQLTARTVLDSCRGPLCIKPGLKIVGVRREALQFRNIFNSTLALERSRTFRRIRH